VDDRRRALERAEARYELRERQAKHDLGLFIEQTTPTFRYPRHLAPFLKLLDESMRRPVFATVSVPPRHFKTDTLLHAVARNLRYYPERTNAYGTYSSEFADRKSRRAKDIAIRGGAPVARGKGRNHAQTVNYWQTTEGGGLLAVGRGSGFTGDGVTGLLVIDDPHKDRQEAESAKTRQDVWDWFTDVALTRLEETASVIVTHTRWHESDLIGRIRASGDFDDYLAINLPAIAGDNDPLGRLPGEALLPEKFSAERLQKLRRKIGEYSFWSLYQGEPRPRGGKLFGAPHYFRTLPETALRFGYGVDMAYTSKKTADWSVCVKMIAAKNDAFEDVFYITHVDRRQVLAPQFGKVLEVRRDEQAAPFFWRAVGPEKGSADLMGALLGVPFVILPSIGDKFVHAQGFAAAWNDGRVFLPAGNQSWIKEFTDEVTSFSGVGDLTDDQVDAAVNAFDGLSVDLSIDYDDEFDAYLPKLRM